MAGVTPEGFIPKTYNEIIDAIVARANAPEFFGEQFPTTPDSVFGILSAIFGASLKDQWDLTQNVADQQNRDKATGKYLDDLAALVGLTRLTESGSRGGLVFSGQQTALIPNRSAVQDAGKRIVLTQEELVLNRSLCYSSDFIVDTVLANTEYTIVVEGDVFNVTSGATPTAEGILTSLHTAIGAQPEYFSSLSSDQLTISVTMLALQNFLTTTNSNNLALTRVSSVVEAVAITNGGLIFSENTLVSIINPISLVSDVTNPETFILGRSEEVDRELRIRMSEQGQSAGSATKPSIEASLLEVAGVESALVIENIELVTDINGIPPKSYESFVTGGNSSSIAEVIWETKPAGILTHGDITLDVVDNNGDIQSVSFSRLTDLYAWVRVTYQINSEEDFPANGEELIRDSVVETGSAMTAGEDFENTKFYGNIYSNVSGVYISLIEIATTNLPTDTPAYTTNRIPVSKTERLRFETSRVPVTT